MLGEVRSRTGKTQRFGLLPEDRTRHVWIVGKTGCGKSTLIENLIAQDLAQGAGVALLDPHGSLVEAVLRHIPRSRLDDVWLLRPSHPKLCVPFNVFSGKADRALLTSRLISVFRKQWSQSWGPRTEHILRQAILATSFHPHASLSLLHTFLIEEQLQEKTLALVTDEKTKAFWHKEWPSYGKRLQAEAMAPVLNKLGAFLGNPVIRDIVSSSQSLLDIQTIIKNRQLLLVDLAIGNIGEDTAELLGGLLLSAIELAAQSRPSGYPPFFVYADEFHRFASDSLRTTLAESRKFGLGLVLAHQYTEQLPRTLLPALLGNIGTTIAFRLGPTDAERLSPVFAPAFSPMELMSLPAFHVAVRQLARGQTLSAFSARSLPPRPPVQDAKVCLAQVIRRTGLRRAQCSPDPPQAPCPAIGLPPSDPTEAFGLV